MIDKNPEGLVKIHLSLYDDIFEIGGESVWAKPLGTDLYEIRSTPWHTCDVNWGDIVKAVPDAADQKPEFLEVVQAGGHRTLHIFFFKQCPAEETARVLAELKKWKASYENADGQLYAVDVEPDGDFDGLCEYLDGFLSDDRLDYRTIVSQGGSDAHPSDP